MNEVGERNDEGLLEGGVCRRGDAFDDGLDEVGQDGGDSLSGVSQKMNDEISKEEASRLRLGGSEQTGDDGEGRLQTRLAGSGDGPVRKTEGESQLRVKPKGKNGALTTLTDSRSPCR